MDDLTIWKAIFEVRYPAAALLFDQRGKIAEAVRGKHGLTDWSIGNNGIILHNIPSDVVFQVEYKRTVFVIEKPETYSAFRSGAGELVYETLRHLEVSNLERIGLRLLMLQEHKNFDALVRRMCKAIYGFSGDVWKILADDYPVDIGIPATLQIGDYKANYQMGPMKKKQLQGYFDADRVQKDIPESSLFVDFDLYTDGHKTHFKDIKKDIWEFLSLGETEIVRRANAFLEHFGGFER